MYISPVKKHHHFVKKIYKMLVYRRNRFAFT